MTTEKALKRLRRKLEIIRLDCRRMSDTRWYDMEECLALVDIIEKEMNNARNKSDGDDTSSVGLG
jgi:hypothetical protein